MRRGYIRPTPANHITLMRVPPIRRRLAMGRLITGAVITCRSSKPYWCSAVLLGIWLLLAAPVLAQTNDPETEPLHLRSPFDRLTLDEQNGYAVIEIFPLKQLDRTTRVSIPPTLTIRRLQDPPDKIYSVSGIHISRLELFPFILAEAAERLIAKGEIDEAYYLIARLKKEYPATEGLTKLTEEYFYKDAAVLFRRKQFDEALQSLNEVYRLNPSRAGSALNSVLGRILQSEYEEGDYSSLRNQIEFARSKYGSTTEKAIGNWEQRLESQSKQELAAAQQAFAKGDATTALAGLRNAQKLWPTLPGLDEFQRTIMQKYPRARVGVTQQFEASTLSVPSAFWLNWATSRVTPLVQRQTVQFAEFTSEGARFNSPAGEIDVDSSRQKITLTLRPELQEFAPHLALELLAIAKPDEVAFSPRWAEYLQSIYLTANNSVEIALTRPTLRPEGLLPRNLPSVFPGGYYETPAQTGESGTQTFQLATADSSAIREIAEIYFDQPSAATNAILRGEVDVVDRVYTPDIIRLQRDPSVQLIPYRLPTLHALVFNDREPLLRDSTFRRGLLYGVDRSSFVSNDINGSNEKAIGEVLSGFAPIGVTTDDPLGYAYDRTIKARQYNPQLALVLLRLAMQQRRQMLAPKSDNELTTKKEAGEETDEETRDDTPSNDDSTTPPDIAIDTMPNLVLAYPDSPVAVEACAMIATGLRKLGLGIKLMQLPAGQGMPLDDQWDILYLETTVQEPLIDIPNLILEHAILGRHGGLVWQATRDLQESRDLSEVRERFMRIHRLTFDHTPMIPLWQIIEYAAVSKSIRGPGKATGRSTAIPSLYHNILEWRLAP